eukprot:353830-Chlamydomonas_euryale.AAC.6
MLPDESCEGESPLPKDGHICRPASCSRAYDAAGRSATDKEPELAMTDGPIYDQHRTEKMAGARAPIAGNASCEGRAWCAIIDTPGYARTSSLKSKRPLLLRVLNWGAPLAAAPIGTAGCGAPIPGSDAECHTSHCKPSTWPALLSAGCQAALAMPARLEYWASPHAVALTDSTADVMLGEANATVTTAPT